MEHMNKEYLNDPEFYSSYKTAFLGMIAFVINWLASLLTQYNNLHIPPIIIELGVLIAQLSTFGLFTIALIKFLKEYKNHNKNENTSKN